MQGERALKKVRGSNLLFWAGTSQGSTAGDMRTGIAPFLLDILAVLNINLVLLNISPFTRPKK
jgi:hypothetical protein